MIMISEDSNNPVIHMKLELSVEHIEAIVYLLENCIRMETVTREQHKKMISYGKEIVKMGKETFLGHYHV